MANPIERKVEEKVLDLVNIVIGIALVLSPWVLGFAAEQVAVWNAGVGGALIALVAASALFAFAKWEEWANLMLGLWTLLSPWLLGFAAVGAAKWVHVIAGLIVAVLAGLDLWYVGKRPSTA